MDASDKKLDRAQFIYDVSVCADDSRGESCKRLVGAFAACEAIQLQYFETKNAHERRCWLKKKNCVNKVKDADRLMDFTIENGELRCSLGKLLKLRPAVARWAGYDPLPENPGDICDWVAKSLTNEEAFREWIVAAATK